MTVELCPPQSLGAAIRALRIDRGRTMGDVARALSLRVPQVSDFERGYARPTRVEMVVLYQLLDLSNDECGLLSALWAAHVDRRRPHTIHTLHGSWATGDRASESVEEDCG